MKNLNLDFRIIVVGFIFSTMVYAKAPPAVEMAITIDDLPAHGPLPKTQTRILLAQEMIRVLQKHSVPEVYGFINGKPADEVPADKTIFSEWIKAGFFLGNHTYSHKDAAKVSREEFLADVDKNEIVLKEYSKDRDFHYFRFPYLREGADFEKRKVILQDLSKRGYKIAEVTMDFNDWAWNEPYDRCLKAAKTAEIVKLEQSYLDTAKTQWKWSTESAAKLFGKKIPQILLLHIGAMSAVMLDRLLTDYEKSGVKFITLKQAVANPVFTDREDVKTEQHLPFIIRHAEYRGKKIPPEPDIPLDKLEQTCR